MQGIIFNEGAEYIVPVRSSRDSVRSKYETARSRSAIEAHGADMSEAYGDLFRVIPPQRPTVHVGWPSHDFDKYEGEQPLTQATATP